MGHPLPRSSFKLILLLILIPALVGCGKLFSGSTSIGVLSAVPTQSAPTGSAALVAQEQNRGYASALKTAGTTFKTESIDETMSQSDIQRTIRDKVEDPKNPMVAVLGATSNGAASRVAALVNFFNLSMLVPSANGDNLFPSNNLWAFRLSAPGSAYANYLFGKVINTTALSAIAGSTTNALGLAPQLKIAILYEENTFGESAAVATATAAINQSIKIGLYSNFPPDNSDPTYFTTLVNKVKDADVQLAYLVTSDSAVAKNLVQTFAAVYSGQNMPILVGQAGGFAAQDFMNSPQAQSVYVMAQKMDPANCPPDVKTIYDAQSYGAVYLLDQAFQKAKTSLAATVPQFSLGSQLGPTPAQQREAIRDALKNSSLAVPCLGTVEFDNTGQNKLLNLGLILVKNGQPTEVTTPQFLDILTTTLTSALAQ